jgi:hypothetical protein
MRRRGQGRRREAAGSSQGGGGGGGRGQGRREEEESEVFFLDDTAGLTLRTKQTFVFFCPLGRLKRTVSDKFEHKNRSIH